jgi:hypothetical protein
MSTFGQDVIAAIPADGTVDSHTLQGTDRFWMQETIFGCPTQSHNWNNC